MKRFLSRIYVFFFSLFILISISILFVNRIIDSGNYFQLKSDITTIILGHSHPECAYNDTLIKNVKNFAQSGESYFYTYIKLKKIIKQNPHVKTILLEFTNNQIIPEMENWISGDEYISDKFPKYAAFTNLKEWFFLFTHNSAAVLNSLSVAQCINFNFIVGQKSNYLNEIKWGGYNRLDRRINDSKTVVKQNKIGNTEAVLPQNQLNYLHEIEVLCKHQNVRLFFIRSPMHPSYAGLTNEKIYNKVLNEEFSNIEMLDFNNYPLTQDNFADFQHLNYKGAKQYSLFVNCLLKKGLLNQLNKQKFINEAIFKQKHLGKVAN